MASLLPNITANLARTLFQGNANDIVATPDVYGVVSPSVINSSVGKYNSFDGSLLGNLRSGSGGLLGTLTALTAGQFNLNAQGSYGLSSLTGRLNSAMGQPLNSLPDSLQRSMNQGLSGIGGTLSGGTSILSGGLSSVSRSIGLSGLFNTIATTVGNVTQNISTSDVTSALSAFNLVNQLTGNRNTIGYIDVGPSTMAMTSLTGTLIGLGLGLAVDALLDSTSDTVARAALQPNVPTAIQSGDLDLVQSCITRLGVGGVLSVMPDAAVRLVGQYRFPQGTVTASYSAILSQLVSILNQLDPAWTTGTRQGVAVDSLTYFTAASADALTLFRSSPTYRTSALIGKGFPSGDMLQTLQRQYPAMVTLR